MATKVFDDQIKNPRPLLLLFNTTRTASGPLLLLFNTTRTLRRIVMQSS